MSKSLSKAEELSQLLKYNLQILDENNQTPVLNTLFETLDYKKHGITVGKIVSFADSQDDRQFLIKKNPRTQIVENDVIVSKDNSKNVNLENQYFESFNEICASKLFNVIKQLPNYLPEIFLVSSTFTQNPQKPYNNPKIKAGLQKIYVGSEIIGNKAEVNLDRKSLNNNIFNSAQGSLKSQLIDDICENAVIMILLLNYDLKLDNFVNIENKMVPIDFGNARYEEKYNTDIIGAIDEIRNSSNSDSKKFSSNSLIEKFKDIQSTSTKRFYKENLKPKHFLQVINKIKSNNNIKNDIRNTAFTYTFGDEEEKTKYGNVVLARIDNLFKLEEIFLNLHQNENSSAQKLTENQKGKIKTFSTKNLRNEVCISDSFKDFIEQNTENCLQ